MGTPAADAKKDDKKTPAADANKTAKKRFRLLQAVKGKATAKPKAKVAVKGKATAKPKAKVTIKGKAKPKAKVTVKGKATKPKATKKAKLHVKMNVKAGAKTPKAPKAKVSAKHKIKIKLSTKSTAFKWQANKHFDNKVAPSEFLKDQECRPAFLTAYQQLYNVNWIRKQTQDYGNKCFVALIKLRGELACAACDNTKSKYFSDPAKLAIKDTDVEDLGYCVALMGHFKKYGDMMRSFLALAWHLGAKDIGNDLRSDWKDTNFNETCGKPATPAKKEDKKPAADTKKPAADTKKPAADTKKDDTKKPAADAKKDATKKRILQQKVNKDADKKPEEKKDADKKPEEKKDADKKADDGKKPEDKKPANPDDWPLDKKTGKE